MCVFVLRLPVQRFSQIAGLAAVVKGEKPRFRKIALRVC